MVRRQGNQTKKDKEKRRAERRSEKKRRAQTSREENWIHEKNEREKRGYAYMYIYMSGKDDTPDGAIRQHKKI